MSYADYIELCIDIAAADSNITQALRGHSGFVDAFLLVRPDDAFRRFFVEEVAAGALIGNAETERTGSYGKPSSTLRRIDGQLRLNGTKYYTTGTLFADWTWVTAAYERDDQETVVASVPVATRGDGVTVTDDWDGFGQRLTASGTAHFIDVEVNERFVVPREDKPTLIWPIYQLNLLATLVGIAEAATADIVDFVRQSKRNAFNPSVPLREDAAALTTVGEARGRTTLARSAIIAAAATVGQVLERQHAGLAQEHEFDEADAAVAQLWQLVIDQVLTVTSRVFEVGGASATASARAFDRHWRNARTVASNNPSWHSTRAVGDWVLNEVPVKWFLINALTGEPHQN